MDLGGAETIGEGTADHALDGLTTALDHLVNVVDDGGVDSFDNGRLLAFLQSFERVRNRLSLVDHRDRRLRPTRIGGCTDAALHQKGAGPSAAPVARRGVSPGVSG